MRLTFVDTNAGTAPVLACGVYADETSSPTLAALPPAVRELVEGALRTETHLRNFTGQIGETLAVHLPPTAPWRRVVLSGAGRRDAVTPQRLRDVGGAAVGAAARLGEDMTTFDTAFLADAAGDADLLVANLAFGALLGGYQYAKWKTAFSKKPLLVPEECQIRARATAVYDRYQSIAEGVYYARDLTNEPPNVLTPEGFAASLQDLRAHGLEIEILDEEDMRRLGMNGLLAVGGGSANRPKLAILTWRGGEAGALPVCFVGKGVTFDAGGLDIKPSAMMRNMKGDMAGGAAVAGALLALAHRKAAVNAVGVIPLAENVISGSAYRPGDVLRMARGDSIEIVNTDAEGRLVLADAMWYAAEHLRPQSMVSIGTLGGSGLFGLGLKYAGLYTEHAGLRAAMLEAGRESGELLWELPAEDDVEELLRQSAIADCLQAGDFMTHGNDSGYIARLLRPSVRDIPWAHVEMCRHEFALENRPTCPKGATGFGVSLFDHVVDRLLSAVA